MSTNVLRWFGIGLLVLAMVGTAIWQMRAHQAMVQWDPVSARSANQPIPVRTVKVDKKDLEEKIGGTAVTMPALDCDHHHTDELVRSIGSPSKGNQRLAGLSCKERQDSNRVRTSTLQPGRASSAKPLCLRRLKYSRRLRSCSPKRLLLAFKLKAPKWMWKQRN